MEFNTNFYKIIIRKHNKRYILFTVQNIILLIRHIQEKCTSLTIKTPKYLFFTITKKNPLPVCILLIPFNPSKTIRTHQVLISR